MEHFIIIFIGKLALTLLPTLTQLSRHLCPKTFEENQCNEPLSFRSSSRGRTSCTSAPLCGTSTAAAAPPPPGRSSSTGWTRAGRPCSRTGRRRRPGRRRGRPSRGPEPPLPEAAGTTTSNGPIEARAEMGAAAGEGSSPSSSSSSARPSSQ